jgi:hypothetical protein
MRQVLIEKYIKPSEIKTHGKYSHYFWYNEYEDRHSILGQPSEIVYCDKSKVIGQFWHKKGLPHRDRGLPSAIYYNLREEKISEYWYKNGEPYNGKTLLFDNLLFLVYKK